MFDSDFVLLFQLNMAAHLNLSSLKHDMAEFSLPR